MRGFNRFKNKFNAKSSNGFASKLEEAVHDLLSHKEKSGQIKDLKRQQTVTLQEGDRDVRITWRVDFSYFDCRMLRVVYAEAKGMETADYKLKLKMWRANPPAPLLIYKGKYRKVDGVSVCIPELVETIGIKAAA